MTLSFRLVLILTLIAGSVLMVPMQGRMAGLSQIEICSDVGTELVTLDARGDPVAPHHLCPDCIACVAMGPLPEIGAVRLGSIALPLGYPGHGAVVAAGVIAIHPAARDPPRPI